MDDHTPLDFPNGATLTIKRVGKIAYDDLGDRINTTSEHTIGPCSIVSTNGHINWEDDGTNRWVGTIDIQAPPQSDVIATDRVYLPNGAYGIIINPPIRPKNPFTGWEPFTQFTIATAGYTPANETNT
ncbi:hypothetical protein CIP107538_01307 [Corynebacterium diphtheriae]|uniref:hypothetical protein n=1 Tax=Corynebacterium diphtheriae TaxID=1717 RepID=UPI000D076AF8|nr:hypothetical protein [Corynebacterium diphtheriae]MBG9277553.1 hypothetical protein [Corynebacterium diphtheriae bv. mitis]MBG9282064.1 hypothetical protein [Corynebacterium diphtheriae bv. mitis]MBG9335762.1 hypothetical protein [Corynebacterium diphtheriae bv. gravis]PSA74256.1 hypothetical protein BT092_04685 [Corynebacterium diphtheriae]CAB0503248.1 hypothetical protein FRC061569_00903 [Corynebacterium diphtheriae]